MKSGILWLVAALTGCISGLATGIAQADVTIESSLSVDGAGMMAFANMSGTSKTVISGDRARSDSDLKMQSKIVGFFARNSVGPSAEIILLDQDKLYHLNVAKKEYTEMTFEQFRAQMQKAQDQMNSNGQRSQPSAIDQSKCEWLPAKGSVTKSGEKAQFAGYDAQRVTITASQPCKDKDTGAICEIALVLDEWMAADFAPGTEARKFYSAYATKMGLDSSSAQDASQKAKMFFSQYKGVWTEIESKLQGIKGYPVKNSFTLAMGGAQCKDSNSDRAPSSTSSPSNDNSGSPNSIAGALAGKLGGLFQKKKDSADAPAAPPAAVGAPVVLPPGDIALMTISSQLISVSSSGAGADSFAVPADYKKIEMKNL